MPLPLEAAVLSSSSLLIVCFGSGSGAGSSGLTVTSLSPTLTLISSSTVTFTVIEVSAGRTPSDPALLTSAVNALTEAFTSLIATSALPLSVSTMSLLPVFTVAVLFAVNLPSAKTVPSNV